VSHREPLRSSTRDYYGFERLAPARSVLVVDMQLIDGVLPAHDARLVRGTLVRAPSNVVYEAALDAIPERRASSIVPARAAAVGKEAGEAVTSARPNSRTKHAVITCQGRWRVSLKTTAIPTPNRLALLPANRA
jgi:hypothetical protein